MRSFYNGSGADSTAAVRSYLAAHRQLFIADLYLIRTAPCFAGNYLDKTFKVTNWPSSLKWDYKGTFIAGNISRGQVESKIGLESDTVQVTWTPKDSDILATDGSGNTIITALQGFPRGVFDNGTIEIWRCLMPTDGDCNTLGACLMFAGRIGNFEPDRLSAQIDVVSRIETLNVQVPTNLIEPTNILAQYLTGQIPTGGPASMAVVAGSTRSKIYADDVASPMVTMPAGTYDSGYIRFTGTAKLAGGFGSVQAQTIESGHHAFYLYEPLPFAPTPGDRLTAYVPIPRDFATAAATDNGYFGFPFVPSPINSSVVIA